MGMGLTEEQRHEFQNQQSDWSHNRQLVQQAEEARAKARKHPFATGFMKGFMSVLSSRMSVEERVHDREQQEAHRRMEMDARNGNGPAAEAEPEF